MHIHSIHKYGFSKVPSNFRGIPLLSLIGKLFSSLVYNRIENEVESKDTLLKQVLGKITKQQTIDHIFTLI